MVQKNARQNNSKVIEISKWVIELITNSGKELIEFKRKEN
jgi:hypothetical protein